MEETNVEPGDGPTGPQPGAGHAPHRSLPEDDVHEAYSFVCLSCAYGWEQPNRAERGPGGGTAASRAPLSQRKPACVACGGTLLRVMSAGRVATAARQEHCAPGYAPHAEPVVPTTDRTRTERKHPHRIGAFLRRYA